MRTSLPVGADSPVGATTTRHPIPTYSPDVTSSDLDAVSCYLETLARQSTGARDTDAALAELRRRGGISDREHSQLDVPGHQVGDRRLIGGSPPSALWRRRVL